MITWFLFTHQWTENQILSVCFDASGQMIEPCVPRSFEALQTLQTNARTVIVLPGELSSLHHVALPWLSEHKARAAIPYALEDHLAQSVTSLQFAFDRKHYQNDQYLVGVIDKLYLKQVIEQLEAFRIHVDVMTLDWFALSAGEACVTESSLLVHQEAFKGAVSLELANTYLQASQDFTDLFVFSDSPEVIEYADPTLVDQSLYEWLAGRLLQADVINFCQGALERGGTAQSSRRWFIGSAVLGLGALCSFIVMHLIQLYWMNHKIDALDQEIAAIYREFFPQAKQVISPRFRINRLLQTTAAADQAGIWQLLSQSAGAFEVDQNEMISLQFQNSKLWLTFNSNDFEALERFQQRLQQQGLLVKQTKALSKQQKVLATLELSL